MRRGVTLLEVLVAAAVLSIGLLGGLEVIANSASATRQAEDRALAVLFARSKLEEILKEPVIQTGSDEGQGVDTSTNYDWRVLVEPSANPALVVITVSARNRVTGIEETLTALRRPDLDTAPDGTSTQPSTEEEETDEQSAVGSGSRESATGVTGPQYSILNAQHSRPGAQRLTPDAPGAGA
jgi:type II secretion system protein I